MNELLTQYSNFKKQRMGFRIALIKHILTISSALIVLLPAFGSKVFDASLYALQLMCILLTMSILFGSVFLWITLVQYDRLDRDFQEVLKERSYHFETNTEYIASRYNKAQSFCEAICLLSFFGALILLALYSVFFYFI
ncbi:MAG: hypothetical protein KIT66_05100 [Chitinophagaceae bacterium]|nr:hypothetical protein [Chitinophagaceae bacterium]